MKVSVVGRSLAACSFTYLMLPVVTYAGDIESTLRSIKDKITGDVAVIVGAIFIAIAGYRMYTGRGGSSVVLCIAAAVIIIKCEDIIRFITSVVN